MYFIFMNAKYILITSIGIALLSKESAAQVLTDKQRPQSQVIERSLVPDASTAIKIAEAVWLPIYGKSIYQQKPFKAVLQNGSVWLVEGSLPEGLEGGVAYIEITKKDGCISNVTHGK